MEESNELKPYRFSSYLPCNHSFTRARRSIKHHIAKGCLVSFGVCRSSSKVLYSPMQWWMEDNVSETILTFQRRCCPSCCTVFHSFVFRLRYYPRKRQSRHGWFSDQRGLPQHPVDITPYNSRTFSVETIQTTRTLLDGVSDRIDLSIQPCP